MYALLPLPRAQASGLRLGAVGEGCAGGGARRGEGCEGEQGGGRGQGGVRKRRGASQRVGQRSQLEARKGVAPAFPCIDSVLSLLSTSPPHFQSTPGPLPVCPLPSLQPQGHASILT